MNVIEQLGLRQDPFAPASSATGFGIAASLLVAREKLLAAVGRGDPLTVLAGRPGMGKTLLLTMIEEAYRADGIDVRSVARGDMAHNALGSRAQVLLIDEADTINTATLKALAPGTASAAAPTMVFAVARPALHRLSSDVRATIIDLRALDPEESRDFLLTRAAQAGRLDLFTPEALNVIVEAGQGSPRLLRVLAGAAMFQAASDGAAQITAAHAGLAAAMHGKLLSLPIEPALPVAANDLEPEDRPRTVVPLAFRRASAYQRAGALSFAASVALAALVLPVFFFPEAADTPSVGVTTANAAQAVSGAAQLPVQLASAFTVAPASAAPRPPLRPNAGAETALHRLAAVAPPLIAAPRPRIATAAIDTRVAAIRPIEARLVTEGAGIARAVRSEVAAGRDRELLIDILAATRLRPAVVAEREPGGGQRPADEALPSPAAPPAAALFAALTTVIDPLPTLAAAPVVTATFAPLPTVVEPRAAPAAPALLPVAVAKTAADETRTTKLAAQQVKEAARQADAAQDVADQAKAAKEAADQAKAGKAAADQAKEAAKEAAEQAKAAKDAAEQSKAAKAAAEQAKNAKDAADQAKAAKDAADQAKAAKEAAEQAKAVKEAVDQAKAAKDAAEQAKAAKEAADQAKAAKDAAEQAKAAKDAVEQAKAAKDAADQAKAAKEAADQAKAAKDAAAQAKAAKDAADQAKEAARAAKDAAKAAKEIAKAAKEAGKGN